MQGGIKSNFRLHASEDIVGNAGKNFFTHVRLSCIRGVKLNIPPMLQNSTLRNKDTNYVILARVTLLQNCVY